MSRNKFDFVTSNFSTKRTHGVKPVRDAQVTIVPVFSTDSNGRRNRLQSRFSYQAGVEGFKGHTGQTMLTSVKSRVAGEGTVLSVGLGESDKFDVTAWRDAITGACNKAKTLKVERIAIVLPDGIFAGRSVARRISAFDLGKATAETVSSVLYTFNHRKTEAGGFKPEPQISFIYVSAAGITEQQHGQLADGIWVGKVLGAAVNQARDTANDPANFCTPTYMAKIALNLAADFPSSIQVEIDELQTCLHNRMHAFCAVSKGSNEPLRFIKIHYKGSNCRAGGPVLGYVGKSVTFDAGGLDIKDGDGMREMKYDMCGGADVLAAMRAIAALNLPIEIKAYCAATENMTGGSAFKPGDVYTMMDGRTVEIEDTDAEGRLTLADAICYARIKGGCTHIVDYATLTGAIVVALGEQAAGVFTNNQDFGAKYMAAAQAASEEAHMMPSPKNYQALNDSKIADIKNYGGRWGGAITAADFVIRAAAGKPIVHVDIAGTANSPRDGATGWGVKTLVALAQSMSESA